MKYIATLLLSIFSASGFSQSLPPLQGAWQHQQDSVTTVWIIAEGYFMKCSFTTEGHRFMSASGGILTQYAQSLQTEVEFNSRNPQDAGSFHLYDYTLSGKTLTIKHHEQVEKWDRIDDGSPGALAGAWLFSGRRTKPDEAIAPYTPGVRKTMKIMSGTRFQWAAYNTETKEFLGTGGGTYTTINGRYTENIAVFSRDNSRVGASLSFDMEIAEPHWLHSGKSSKGDPIYERWTRRKTFAGQ